MNNMKRELEPSFFPKKKKMKLNFMMVGSVAVSQIWMNNSELQYSSMSFVVPQKSRVTAQRIRTIQSALTRILMVPVNI